MKEEKPFKTIDEQIALLEERGLIIDDIKLAKRYLEYHNYYRLSGYSLTLRKSNAFHNGIKFSHITQIYNFDSELKTTLLNYLAHAEVNLRTHIGYIFGKLHGPYGYMKEENYINKNQYNLFLESFEKALIENRNEVFVKHHMEKKNKSFPIWVTVEILSFGNISKFFKSIHFNIQKEICQKYYYNIRPKYISNWTHVLCVVRNMCAHRARLFNRGLATAPLFSKEDLLIFKSYGYTPNEIGKSLFFALIILDRIIDDESLRKKFINDFKTLMTKYPFVDIKYYGFKSNWEEIIQKVNNSYY